MRLHLSVSVCFGGFVACSTALSSSAYKTSGSTIPSRVAGESTKIATASASIPSVTSHEPCLLASKAIASFTSFNSSVPTPIIPAKIAYNCLKSVPIVKKDALRLVTNLGPYLELQSTIGFLKDPPSGYLLPGVDILAGLSRIESLVRDDVYTSEYDFELDLYTLVHSAHDGHFDYSAEMFNGVFKYQRTQVLASISKDGLDLPKIYLQDDLRPRENGSFSPSPVVSIDGINAVTFLQDWAFGVSYAQDPDAAYNSLFSSIPAHNIDGIPQFSASLVYPGESTTFSFENGTTKSFPNIAVPLRSLKGITSGKDLYTKVLESELSATPSSSSVSTKSEKPLPTGYPVPVVKHTSNLVSGFFLNDSAFNEVAVLSVPSFMDTGSFAEIQEFQKVLEDFLAKAKKSKKTKLIIDLQANPGGEAALGFELYAQLFPSLPAYIRANLRATKVNEVLGQIVSGLNATSQAHKLKLDTIPNADPLLDLLLTPYNSRQDILPDGSAPYRSWSEFYGPIVTSNDNFTNLFQQNYSDPIFASEVNLIITGTGNRTNFSQPFATKDIVILSDGNCASTCALFSELMKTWVGVSTIVVGGRPQYGPMQGIGGVKGAEVLHFAGFISTVGTTYEQAPLNLQAKLNDTSLVKADDYPLIRSPSSTFNFRNSIRRGDASVTPLQFVYDAADCRFFYTAEMLDNVSTIWTRVANMAFGNSSSARQDWARNPQCVRGSTGHRSSVSGGGRNNTDYAGSAPPAEAKSQAQLPLLSDGTRMGWRLDLPSVANGSSTDGNSSYARRTSQPAYSNSAARRVAEKFHVAQALAAGLGLLLCFKLG